MQERHEFLHFMYSAKEWLASEYERIQRRTHEDPGTAGDQAEENWAYILRNWLPANYSIVTKGRIIDQEGITSPQVDIIILHPSYPLGLRDKKLYFAGGVVGVFECKLTLRTSHLKKAFQNASLIKNMLPKRQGSIYDELNQPIIYGILAHSHDIRMKDLSPHDAILEKLYSYALDFVSEMDDKEPNLAHPRYLMDLVCVSDAATFTLRKLLRTDIDQFGRLVRSNDRGIGDLDTGYFVHREEIEGFDSRGFILAKLISEITVRLAFEDSSLQPFAKYLEATDRWGSIGKSFTWKPKIFSRAVLSRLKEEAFEDDLFSKWNDNY